MKFAFAAGAAHRSIVLVHGAWHGGWCWKKLTPLLASRGRAVYTPTLTGLGDRAHLATPDVNLDMHIQDLQAFLEMEDLHDVTLVGHSYGGFVISGVADRSPSRLRSLIYLDAFVPESGRSVIDYLPDPERRAAIVKSGSETGYVPPLPLELFGVTRPQDLAWANTRITRQPFATFQQPISLKQEAARGLPRAFIACTNPSSGSFDQFAERIRKDASWTFRELPCGHNAMMIAPTELARVLEELNDTA
jgi:pimeloyl-ACP methyl ester carboxylesterase